MPSGSNLDKPTLDGATTGGATGCSATPALTILYHPQLDRVGDRVLLPELADGGVVRLSRGEPNFGHPRQTAQAEPLDDEHISRKPIQLRSDGDGGVLLHLGDATTAVSIQGKRVREKAHLSAAEVQRGVVIELGRRVVLLLHTVVALQQVLGRAADVQKLSNFVGQSDALLQLMWDIKSVADLTSPVLIRGETGTGKELVAQAIHKASPRQDRPFVVVHAGSITSSLAEAELFGAEKGAYSGLSERRRGLFEQADGGTLFLDEIGDAPMDMQVKLLRAVEVGELQTVGAKHRHHVDVRVIAATDADLEGKIAAGTFRPQLLMRLSGSEIRVPPLRERRDDIGRLFVHFLRDMLERTGEVDRLQPPGPEKKPWLAASLVARLGDHDWPGNIRQLKDVVHQLVVDSRGRERLELTSKVERLLTEWSSAGPDKAADTVESAVAEAPSGVDMSLLSHGSQPPMAEPLIEQDASAAVAATTKPIARRTSPGRRRPESVTEDELRNALRASRWEPTGAAERLDIPRASVYMLQQRFGIRTIVDIEGDEIARCHDECGGDLDAMVQRLSVSKQALARRVRELKLK